MRYSSSLLESSSLFSRESEEKINIKEKTPQQVAFVSVGSGSSGNCYYFSSPQGSLLIDVGVPIRMVEHALQSVGKSLCQIDAILVTHGHSDHTRNVARLSVLYDLPVIATPEVFLLLDSLKTRFKIFPKNRIVIKEEDSLVRGGFKIESFTVPHDCPETVGYTLTFEDFRLALLTDVGHYLPLHYSIARSCNHLILESNFDREMLINGGYPYSLKQRIASDLGHTGNYEAALFLSQVYHSKMQRVWLCHLSKDNNTPDCCYKTFQNVLGQRGIPLESLLSILPRFKATPLYLFNLRQNELAIDSETRSAEVAV